MSGMKRIVVGKLTLSNLKDKSLKRALAKRLNIPMKNKNV